MENFARRARLAALFLGITGVCAVSVWAVEEAEEDPDETPVAMDQVPAPVQSAIQAQAQGAEDLVVVLEKDDDFLIYEAEYKLDGVEHSIKFTASGELMEQEHVVSGAEIPEGVRTGAADEYPKGEIVEVQKVVATYYEVKVKSGGKTREILVYANGMEVECED